MTDLPADTRAFGHSVLAVMEGDITQVAADAIVNAANNAFAAGGGVDGAIRRAAGPELSGEMRRRYPSGTPTGSALSTGAYGLPARWVIPAIAAALEGVFLRPQQSKYEPWYFQVRHPRFRQVVAYTHPRPGEVRIEYRLPGSHDTYGLATGRDSFHGIVLTARSGDDLDVAARLLRDALARGD